ncbi:uncharacterized protein LOC129565909 [Sitodiplosis mosellana]|uniref:uncharacterized protein LOC129565909 n=1 Tax=Sitodiplosis mosellana TaxID=263140 RepID=UPI002444B2C2|nr:uncharacterized protein LOC129565909 [Sitodiplosis mosellana]
MLWQKETKKKGGLYVDVFELNGGHKLLNEVFRPLRSPEGSTLNKNDSTSLQNRKEGNEQFGRDNWNDAMEMYNASLRYAENGSKNISLAYANRSACFLKMKRYNECLIDVELAKEAGYPVDLMPKLDRRKEDCLKGMAEGGAPVKFEPKLDFKPDEHFPCMANVLKINRDDGGEFTVIAKEDIDVGQTVILEKAFIAYVFMLYGWKCNVCLKEHVNLMPCEKCTSAMFCSKECQGNSLHKYECGLRECNDSQMNGSIMRVVRSCLMAIDMFSTIDELINFVEHSLKSDPYQTPTVLSDAKSQYKIFMNLPLGPDSTIPQNISCIVFEVYRMLLNIPHVKAMFSSEKSRRFLMHLIGHHYYILEHNSTGALGHVSNNPMVTQSDPIFISTQVGLITRFFRHSCAPNLFVSTFHGNTVITTVRPIKKGDQLMYSHLMLMTEPTKKRQKALWDRKRIICTCSLCNGVSASTAQRKQLTSDPDFQYIVSYFDTTLQNDQTVCKTMADKCKQFLQKYGRILWCEELGKVVQAYIYLINIQYRGLIKIGSILHID